VILVEKLTREFAGVEVLGGLNLTVAEGERLAVRPANGCGKTTLLRCLLGTLAPSSGRVEIGGHEGARGGRRDVGVDAPDQRLGVREPPSAAPRREMDEQCTERTECP